MRCSASDSVGLIFTRSYRFTLQIMTPTATPSIVKTSLKSDPLMTMLFSVKINDLYDGYFYQLGNTANLQTFTLHLP